MYSESPRKARISDSGDQFHLIRLLRVETHSQVVILMSIVLLSDSLLRLLRYADFLGFLLTRQLLYDVQAVKTSMPFSENIDLMK